MFSRTNLETMPEYQEFEELLSKDYRMKPAHITEVRDYIINIIRAHEKHLTKGD